MTTRSRSAFLRMFLLTTIVLGACVSPSLPRAVELGLAETVGQHPTAFMPNPGIWDPAVRFRTRGTAGAISFGFHEVLMPLAASIRPGALIDGLQRAEPKPPDEPAQLRLRFEGANPAATVVGAGELEGLSITSSAAIRQDGAPASPPMSASPIESSTPVSTWSMQVAKGL